MTMKEKTKNRRWRTIWIVVGVILVTLGALYFTEHPRPAKDVVLVQCKWFERGSAEMPTAETSDPAVIARIAKELSKGRFVIPLSKSPGVAVIVFKDSKGYEQKWTLYIGNGLGDWERQKKYYVSSELEKILRETMSPEPSSATSTTSTVDRPIP